MLERAHDAIFIWELSRGEIVYWNRGAELLYGFSRAEAIGRISYELLQTTHPDSRDSFEEALARDGEWAGELTHIARDGRVLAILSRHQVLREPDGRRYVLEIGRDITERQILERRTREALDALLEVAAMMVSPALSEGMGEEADEGMGGDGSLDLHVEQAEALRQLTALCCEVLDCARIAIVTVDPETELLRPLTITGASARQERRWRAEVGGLRLTERFGATVTERLRAGEAALVDMAQMRSHDPAQRLSSRRFIIAPMLAEGQLVGYIGANFGDMVDDYSPEQKALTQAVARLVGIVLERWQLQRMRAETQAHALALEETAERMNAFMAIASHELRSPLTSILGGLQISTRRVQKLLVAAEDGMVREGESRDVALQELQELLTRSERQAKRLNRLVGDLIDAVRINAAKFEIVRGPAELTHIVQASVEDQRAAAPARAITVSFPVTGAVPIFADADRISQVVINFLTNAHKYSPEGQPIEVEVRMIGNDQVRVAVRDHGPGLPPEEHARIWQRFHQVEGIEAQNVSGVGLGLGLHVSKTIIERHGGEVGVESTPGQGATFWFTLPVSDIAAGEAGE